MGLISKTKKYLLLILSIVFCLQSVYAADVYVNITKKGGRRLFIWIPEFTVIDQKVTVSKEKIKEYQELLKRDVRGSGLFRVEEAEVLNKLKSGVDYKTWAKNNLDFVLVCEIGKSDKDNFSAMLYDVASKKMVFLGRAASSRMVSLSKHRSPSTLTTSSLGSGLTGVMGFTVIHPINIRHPIRTISFFIGFPL